MQFVSRIIFVSTFLFFSLFITSALAKENQIMTITESKQWIQDALHYGFDIKTKDYTKYMSPHYIEHIDGKVFNFKQWLHHMDTLKSMMKSYKLSFDEIVVEGNQIATSYVVHATKKDNSKIDIRIIAIFKIKDRKMIYVDELTHILKGDVEAGFASHD